MVAAESFVSELEGRNRDSFERLVAGYLVALGKESLGPIELVKLEMKYGIESVEIAALWLADCDSLDLKLALAAQCGDGGRHHALLSERLRALGVAPETFDPRLSGFSKLFAFLRSLSTNEERACAGQLTVRAFAVVRQAAVATLCEEKGDADTAALLRGELASDHQRHINAGRGSLLAAAINEESQARARRASFRAVELLGEIQEPSLLRKFISRSKKSS